MAITQNPAIGWMKNKIDGLIGYRQFGKNIIRSKPLFVNTSNQPNAIAQREAFQFINDEYKKFEIVIKAGLIKKKNKSTAQNYFIKENFKFVNKTTKFWNSLELNNFELCGGTLSKVTIFNIEVVAHNLSINIVGNLAFPLDSHNDVLCGYIFDKNNKISRAYYNLTTRITSNINIDLSDFDVTTGSGTALLLFYSNLKNNASYPTIFFA